MRAGYILETDEKVNVTSVSVGYHTCDMHHKLRRLLCLIVAGSVLISACTTPAAVTPTVVPAPTLTTVPVQAPTHTVEVVKESTVTVAPTVLQPTSVPDTPQASAVPLPPDVVVFTSHSLGISFHYLKNSDDTEFTAYESGDKVYVAMKTAPVDSGQWLQVFHKPNEQPLEDAIKTQVLRNYSLSDCLVKIVSDPNKLSEGMATPNLTFAMIGIPQSPDDDPETIQTKAAKCPQPYAAVGGLAYFMSDSNAPERFVFFSIGQYGIPAEQNKPWQTTLKFIAASGQTTGNLSARQ